jgi:histidinol-phosphate aminotransferase
MAGYVPGYQPPDISSWIKLNTNENPYPPSPAVRQAILAELGRDGASLRTDPSASSQALREIAGELYGFDPSWIIMANGSDEVLNNLVRACAGEGEEIGYIHPSYSYYATLAEIQGATVRTFGLTDDFRIAGFPERYEGRLFFLTTPNSPLGFAFPLAYVEELASRCAGLLVVDEAYADFAEANALDLVRRHDNVVVTRTLSKSYALAGMRLGLAIARPEIIAALDKIRDHYNLDRLAQAAAARPCGTRPISPTAAAGSAIRGSGSAGSCRPWATASSAPGGTSSLPRRRIVTASGCTTASTGRRSWCVISPIPCSATVSGSPSVPGKRWKQRWRH